MHDLLAMAAALDAGRVTARALTEECLDRIADPAGEGALAFTHVDAGAARAQADAMDALRRAGRAPSALAGIPVAIKDLADIAGQVTRAGSTALASQPPASATATSVARLIGAGFVLLGRTNMSEFAFSGLGINPHYGTPASPWDRATRRIPGGSSSGAAVAVADGMAPVALGTDTGGSCRIPAAFCGVVGWKPTQLRVPLDGIAPLAPSLDSVGALGRTVACCALADAVMAGEKPDVLGPAPLLGRRFLAPTTLVLDQAEHSVLAAFQAALATLRAAGAVIEEVPLPVLEEIPKALAKCSFAASEAFAMWREVFAAHADDFDPRIRERIAGGGRMLAADYIDLLRARARLIVAADVATESYDAILAPTAAMLPPPIAALEAEEALFHRTNALALRNTSFFNFLDRCAISLPCTAPGAPPVGLMVVCGTMQDRRLLSIAAAIEARLGFSVPST